MIHTYVCHLHAYVTLCMHLSLISANAKSDNANLHYMLSVTVLLILAFHNFIMLEFQIRT